MTRRGRRVLDVVLWSDLIIGSVLVVFAPHPGTAPWWVGMALLVVATIIGLAFLILRGPAAPAPERVRT